LIGRVDHANLRHGRVRTLREADPGTAGAEAYVEELGHLLSSEELPHLTAMLAETVVGQAYDFSNEFLTGLDLILDGLEERHRQ
jgi:hypothetical protein